MIIFFPLQKSVLTDLKVVQEYYKIPTDSTDQLLHRLADADDVEEDSQPMDDDTLVDSGESDIDLDVSHNR
jgi:hypothetical protein